MKRGALQRAASIVTAAVLACMTALITTSVTAQAATAPTYQHWTGDIYYVVGSTASTDIGAYQKGVNIIDGYYKELGTLSNVELYTAEHKGGTYSLAFRKSAIDNFESIHAQCQSWCAASMPIIVPQGTGVQNALTRTAAWVADYMTYDQTAMTDIALANYYQNALVGFAGGKGLCATYSTMFDTMVNYLPINPSNMTVDYTCTTPVHIETRYVSNASHGWSAVLIGTQWYMYDVTNYDNMNGVRQPQFLGVPVTL